MRTLWEQIENNRKIQKIPMNNSLPPLTFFPQKKNNLAPLGACWLTSLAAKNFYLYFWSLPFLD